MAAAKKQTKKDLENKIAELEAKLNKLSTQLGSKPAETKPEAPKPEAPKPAETKAEAPKPAETTAQPPATFQAALENAYMNAPMTDLHHYRAKTTGYTPASNRYFVRLHAPVGKVPTSNWNEQKATLTGYTQPSNQYFATRQRLAYSPPGKTFGTFSGVNMSIEGVEIKAQVSEPPKPAEITQEAPPPQQSSSSAGTKKQSLEEYEAEYMTRLANEQREHEELMRAAAELKAKSQAQSSSSSSQSAKGSLPKGF